MKKFIAVLSPLALSLALIATPASAGHGDRHAMHLFKQLNLTSEQRQDIKQIRSQSRQDKRIYREDFKAIKQELKGYIHSNDWNENAVRELLSQKQTLGAGIQLQKAQTRNQMWNLLSEEQQQNWQILKGEQKATRAERKSKGKKRQSFYQNLGLTESQLTEVEGFREKVQNVRTVNKQAMKQFYQQQKSLIQSNRFDTSAWQKLWAENKGLKLEMALAKAEYRHKVWNLLTEEQQQKMASMKKKRKHKGHRKSKHLGS